MKNYCLELQYKNNYIDLSQLNNLHRRKRFSSASELRYLMYLDSIIRSMAKVVSIVTR